MFHLRGLTPVERAALYNSATPDEQLVIEEASRSVGRIPTKRADRPVAWMRLIAPEMVNESVVAGAAAKIPQGAQRLQELEEIPTMQVSVVSLAAAAVKETFGSLNRDGDELTGERLSVQLRIRSPRI